MLKNNIIYHHATLTRKRRNTANRHRSVVVWLTGLSGSGKSTLAHAVEEVLFTRGCLTFVLDGDNIRHGLSRDLGFDHDDRKENIRRIGEVAKLMIEAGTIVITAFISPFQIERDRIRKMMSSDDFIEIYCQASLEVCEKRDTKGLYKKARAGEIKNYTGIDSPYEPPLNPEMVINTEVEDLAESVQKIIKLLQKRGIINAG